MILIIRCYFESVEIQTFLGVYLHARKQNDPVTNSGDINDQKDSSSRNKSNMSAFQQNILFI